MEGTKASGKVGIVCCSNGQLPEFQTQNAALAQVLRKFGLEPVFSNCIYARDTVSCGSGRERARELMKLYRMEDVREIFDLSGGDLANGVLDYLDYDVIARSGKRFWGYSDLTTVLNAIYAKTGRTSVLYQVKNLVYAAGNAQRRRFYETVLDGGDSLFQFDYEFLQGEAMEGTVVGGNLRCLLKLAGTPYFPDMTGKLLLLEAYGGLEAQISACLCQLKQMGVFTQIAGLILGTFTRMEEKGCRPTAEDLALELVPPALPVIKTREIGHSPASKAVAIGAYRRFSKGA